MQEITINHSMIGRAAAGKSRDDSTRPKILDDSWQQIRPLTVCKRPSGGGTPDWAGITQLSGPLHSLRLHASQK